MPLVFSAITPHPPIIIPTIGAGADLKLVEKTIKAMEKLGNELNNKKPETIIIISPHAQTDYNTFNINQSPTLSGNFHNFGDLETNLKFKNDLDLIENIKKECEKEIIPINFINNPDLDHGVLVPLYYLAKKYSDFKIIPLSFSYLDRESHFLFGKALFSAIEKSRKKTAIVASGDLSHCLTKDAPVGYNPLGEEFDKRIVDFIKKKDVKDILEMGQSLVENAAECGYRSIVILLGALDKLNYKPEILSYEGPFGVGYLVANLKL